MTDPRYPITLVRVLTARWSAKPFCAGVIFRGPFCIEAAPILGWMRGKHWSDLQRACRKNGWRAEVVDDGRRD